MDNNTPETHTKCDNLVQAWARYEVRIFLAWGGSTVLFIAYAN